MTRSRVWDAHDHRRTIVRAQDRELRQAREVIKVRSRGQCEARFAALCTGVGVHAHHMVLRSQTVINRPEFLAWVCSWCHADIHSRVADARAVGLIVSAPQVEMFPSSWGSE